MLLIYGQHETRQNQLINSTEELASLVFRAGTYKFWGSDNKQIFDYHKRTLPKDHEWHSYLNRELIYSLNSQHYRAPEWNQVDWSKSVLLFGCSQIFGTGLDDSETVGSNLQTLLNHKVINLGVPAASPMLQWVNTGILRQHNIAPLSVIYVWTYPERITILDKDKMAIHSGPWNKSQEPMFYAWNYYKNHSLEYLRYVIMSVTQQWAGVNCPVFHFTSCNETKEILNVDFLPNSIDFARDRQHIGPRTSFLWADMIYNKIKSCYNNT